MNRLLCLVLCLLASSSVLAAFDICKVIGPIPNTEHETVIYPRAVTYFSYFFPPRENLTNRFALTDSKRGRAFFEKKVCAYDPKTRKAIWKQSPNWQETLKTDWTYQSIAEDLIQKEAARFFWANPSYRRTEYAGDEICGSAHVGIDGMRVHQILTEPGFPAEIPIFSCKKKQNMTSVKAVFVLPQRDFISLNEKVIKLAERKELYKYDIIMKKASIAFSHPAQASYALFRTLTDDHKWPARGGLLQVGTRDSGGQIWESPKSYAKGTGRLQLAPDWTFLHEFDKWQMQLQDNQRQAQRNWVMQEVFATFGWGMTLFVGEEAGELKDGEVIVNVDTLLRQRSNDEQDKEPLTPTESSYSRYEIDPQTQWDFNQTLDETSNLKLTISWDEWSCCSTCCCPKIICGVMATVSEKDCAKVKSIKTRRGFLSLVRIDPEEKVDLTYILEQITAGIETDEEKEFFQEDKKRVEEMFELSPYREKGIPLYSTIIPPLMRKPIVQNFFEPKLLKAMNLTGKTYDGLGLFITTASCADDRQKKDCYELARCRRISLPPELDATTADPPVEKDPCEGVVFLTLTMDEPRNWFKLQHGQHYRLQVEEVIFNVTGNVKWKVNGKTAQNYRDEIDCNRQGIVTRGKMLLFTNGSKMDDELQIEAWLAVGVTVKATLKWVERETSDGTEGDKLEESKILWIILGLSIGFILLMMLAIVIDHHVIQPKRLERTTRSTTEKFSSSSRP